MGGTFTNREKPTPDGVHGVVAAVVPAEVWVLYCGNDDARWVEGVFTTAESADEAELWFTANKPTNGRYYYESGEAFKLRVRFDPELPYG